MARESIDLVDQVIEGLAKKYGLNEPAEFSVELRNALREMGYEIAKKTYHVPGSARW